MKSLSLYNSSGLRFWTEEQIELREMFITRLSRVVKQTLSNVNKAWIFSRIEGPILTPKDYISSEYTPNDLFQTNHKDWNLRAETTASSYRYAQHSNHKLPHCVWQVGKSFRRELSDGATAAKLRFNEFYQLEFQCIYSDTTMANYRDLLLAPLAFEVASLTGKSSRIVESDRIPSYSESTWDIEIYDESKDRYFEVASCSIRNDFKNGTKVCEIAFGLDRLVELRNDFN